MTLWVTIKVGVLKQLADAEASGKPLRHKATECFRKGTTWDELLGTGLVEARIPKRLRPVADLNPPLEYIVSTKGKQLLTEYTERIRARA